MANELRGEMALHERIDNDFTYHRPDEADISIHSTIRLQAREYAHYLVSFTPPGREQSLALTHLEEVVFWANAAIARKP